MKKTIASLILLATAAAAQAQVTISEPWVRGTVAQQKATGAFMQISTQQPVRLVAASATGIPVVELHEMTMENNVMKMRQIKALDIVPGHALALKPGGYHIMLMELKTPLQSGDVVPLTLTFEDVATKKTFTQEVKAPVTALGAGNAAPAPAMHHKH